MAASTITQTLKRYGDNLMVLEFTCTASSVDGSYLSTVSTDDVSWHGYTYTHRIRGWHIYKVQTLYGTVAPLDNSDLVINDSNSVDLLGGAGTDQIDNATNNGIISLIGGGTPGTQPIDSKLTPVITNNNVNSAVVTIKLFLTKG